MSYVYLVNVLISQYEQVEISSDVPLDDDEVSKKAASLAEKLFDCDELETGEVSLSLTRSYIPESRPTPNARDASNALENLETKTNHGSGKSG